MLTSGPILVHFQTDLSQLMRQPLTVQSQFTYLNLWPPEALKSNPVNRARTMQNYEMEYVCLRSTSSSFPILRQTESKNNSEVEVFWTVADLRSNVICLSIRVVKQANKAYFSSFFTAHRTLRIGRCLRPLGNHPWNFLYYFV